MALNSNCILTKIYFISSSINPITNIGVAQGTRGNLIEGLGFVARHTMMAHVIAMLTPPIRGRDILWNF